MARPRARPAHGASRGAAAVGALRRRRAAARRRATARRAAPPSLPRAGRPRAPWPRSTPAASHGRAAAGGLTGRAGAGRGGARARERTTALLEPLDEVGERRQLAQVNPAQQRHLEVIARLRRAADLVLGAASAGRRRASGPRARNCAASACIRSRSPSAAISGSFEARRIDPDDQQIAHQARQLAADDGAGRSRIRRRAPASSNTAAPSSRATVSAMSNCRSRPMSPSTVVTSSAVTVVPGEREDLVEARSARRACCLRPARATSVSAASSICDLLGGRRSSASWSRICLTACVLSSKTCDRDWMVGRHLLELGRRHHERRRTAAALRSTSGARRTPASTAGGLRR